MKSNPRSILLVEDNPAHAELVIRGLEDHAIPAKIYHVADGKAAIEYLFRQDAYADAQRSPRPQVILLDLRLPLLSGFEVLQKIKASDELREIPVVILTSSEAPHDIAHAYTGQTNSYIVKPTDFIQFMDMIEGLCSYWLGWNRASVSTR